MAVSTRGIVPQIRNLQNCVRKYVTSNEFVKASAAAFVNETTLAVICSMRGTPETIEAANCAKKLGAATIALYIDESELTEVCDYKIHYDSVAIDAK